MKIVAFAVLALAPSVVIAQDLQPVLSLPDMAQGQVISSTAKGYAAREAARRDESRRPHAGRLDCSDYAYLEAHRASLSREDYARYYACRRAR